VASQTAFPARWRHLRASLRIFILILILCRESLTKPAIEEFHEHGQSVNRFVVALVQSDSTLPVIRRPGVPTDLPGHRRPMRA
jgi:hypothetical protein